MIYPRRARRGTNWFVWGVGVVLGGLSEGGAFGFFAALGLIPCTLPRGTRAVEIGSMDLQPMRCKPCTWHSVKVTENDLG